ncbi:MAG: hypothetical protein Q8K30_05045 [Candidatus Gracilibacteria bacterium]|nr:hypothetical protein [Candidatus Gracilibacteria bacterium]
MGKELISLEGNKGRALGIDVFETKYPCLFNGVNDTGYLTVTIEEKIHFLGTFLNGVFHFRPFLTELMLDDIEANLQSKGILLLKEEIQDNVLDLINGLISEVSNDIKKD